ncbi:MAG TPA: ABC transporter ATP-binding protein [Chloroflexus aurantiacus]|uniref:Oligopeptide/dipeptide ABC transporter, ATPase subunit n=1 Tax=Chloroflexus aurantiacus (strain ATCC 29366 / DSM 635 / J-10-fl) TaxID=324602 RepID=A9WBN9_CHLAA|nr:MULTISPECIES: dipeptide ABC transporter ATP-binding protein [Chloroflexus]ABY34846.1 oligopeptide/dipeptide ABC transporter, ATPase subunit [Chloroflexus aurantiacus J-10-fl]RMG48883.1 MAG: dipeptide ABC transporter ATP-binding protein [Chloroflexota bacterium]GIV92810.1 MAG: ABC transporter ATP-binding protein [Chloroflexus sp.]HBW67747.1 ABC transporter ATP-binding protein [Chloroflexus aurantiacus]
MTSPVLQPANDTLLEVRNLKKYFPIKGGFLRRTIAEVRAVDDVSFTVKRGETLGLVGESGCGKTTTGRTVLRLERATAGEVIFEGQDVMRASGRTMKALRRDMQIIFQDPYASLDPRITIGESVAEGLVIHGIGTPAERRERVREVLAKVGLSASHMSRFPHEFSGGQRQRIGIARALIMEPKLIVCDEPVSALDVSIQSQVLNLLRSLQREFGLTYLFIAHNLAVVEHISDRVGVMYLGKMVELTTSEELFREPLHPYTKALISAIPNPNPFAKRERIVLQGDVPSPINPPSGCRFHPRCWIAKSICKEQEPVFEEKRKGHWVACHFAGQF